MPNDRTTLHSLAFALERHGCSVALSQGRLLCTTPALESLILPWPAPPFWPDSGDRIVIERDPRGRITFRLDYWSRYHLFLHAAIATLLLVSSAPWQLLLWANLLPPALSLASLLWLRRLTGRIGAELVG